MNDPRGPLREVVASEYGDEYNLVTFECGHVGKQTSHHAKPKVGTTDRCYQCRKELSHSDKKVD